jgi:acyl-CoA synthetase (AMP-forming)/AMP-acid ligase II
MIIPDTIYNTIYQYPEKIGIVSVDDKIQLTYREFKNRIDMICAFFQSEGCKKYDKIAILHTNSHLYMEIYYAAAFCGIILVPLNHRLAVAELSFMCDDAGVEYLISEYVFREKSEGILKECPAIKKTIWTRLPADAAKNLGPNQVDYEQIIGQTPAGQRFEAPDITHDDIAQIYYTSGSTGRPKGVIMTHMNMTFDAIGTIVEYRLTDEDVYIHTAPMFHLTDACLTWAVTWIGGRHILVSKFDPAAILRTFEAQRVTVAKMVPMMWNQLVHHPQVKEFDFSSLRLVISGGAPISPTLIQKMMDTFQCEYVQNYGMTETTQFVTISRLKENLRRLPHQEQIKYRAATGRPFIGVKLRVVDENEKDVANDGKEVGEIIVKGDIVTPGYWNMPEENQKAFKDGWLHTGDMATIDREQYIRIVDRKKDMIVTGGENVFCIEVENALYKHPAVLEACVIGVPDAKWGEAVKAIVALKEGQTATKEELIEFCKGLIAHYKSPKSVDLVKELPKTGSGKIYKKAIREPYWKGYDKQVHGT